MKKLFSPVLALILCLSLVGCGAEKPGDNAGYTVSSKTVGSSNATDPAEQPEENPVLDGQTDGPVEDSAVMDKAGNIYTLSSPILYTIDVSELDGINDLGYGFFERVKEEVSTIYAVSNDTLITTPDGVQFDCMLGSFIEEMDGELCATDPIGPGPSWTEFQLEEGWEGGLFMFPCYTTNEAEPDVSVDFVDYIAFFVPWDETAGNPFST